jgi:hypothetical protein
MKSLALLALSLVSTLTFAQSHPTTSDYWKEQVGLSNTVWQKYVDETSKAMDQTKSNFIEYKKMPVCSLYTTVTKLSSSLLKNPDEFQASQGNILFKIDNSGTNNILSVNSYHELAKNLGKEQSIQTIPSAQSVAYVFKQRKTVLDDTMESNLQQNLGGITIPTAIYKHVYPLGKTVVPQGNLREETIEEIATTAYFLSKNPNFNITPEQYIIKATYAYGRNLSLCLYNI